MFFVSFFFFNDTATTEIYTLSLHDALPISCDCAGGAADCPIVVSSPNADSLPCAVGARMLSGVGKSAGQHTRDRKSTRLNSSHSQISYAVFCLKKKKNNTSHIDVRTKFSMY